MTARNLASTSLGEPRPKRICELSNKRAVPLKFLKRRKVRARRPRFADRHLARGSGQCHLADFGHQSKADLPSAGQLDIDLRKQLRIEQGAVLHAMAAVDSEAHAQCVQAVLGARMPGSGK